MRVKQGRLADTLKLIEKNRQTQPGSVVILGHDYDTSPEVFNPEVFLDTEVFAKAVKERTWPGMRLLEIGPGSGPISIESALAGAIVTAVDINPAAVEQTRHNAIKLGATVEVLHGDLYTPLPHTAEFDVIFWNTPFAWVPEATHLSALKKAIADPGYHATERFIREGRKYLAPGGKLWIGFSPELGHVELLKKLIRDHGYTYHKLFETQSEEVRPVRFQILEALPK